MAATNRYAMKQLTVFAAYALIFVTFRPQPSTAEATRCEADNKVALEARDRASVEDLEKVIAQQKVAAKAKDNLENHLRLALLQTWLCEAAQVHENNKLVKQAATEGLSSAERAVTLNPQSSEAHQLVGECLSQLIPHVFGGGMRYGKRSAAEMDKAIELDPANQRAYVSRAISYYYTPAAFGGGQEKAFAFLRKAIELDPKADTPHAWMATFFLEAHQLKEALREITAAREINPHRAFTNTIFEQINTTMKRAANSH